MNELQAQSDSGDLVGDQKSTAGIKKKKASWLRTVLWMLSMVLLANVVMAVFAYFLFFRGK